MDPTRMTPHRWRRTLQLINVVLGSLLITTAVLVLGADGEAQARLDPGVRAGYQRSRMSGLRWTPQQPVTQDAMAQIVWRYEAHAPAHWPFSGPLPPAPREIVRKPDVDPSQPARLGALGHVTMVAHDPATGSAIGFHFDASNKDRGFSPGEVIRSSEDEPARFRLKAVREIGRGVFDVVYDVLDAQGVAATETLRVDTTDEADPEGECIGPLPKGDKAMAGAKAPAPKAGESEARLVTTGPRVQLRSLRPKTHVNPKNSRDRVIEFDVKTHAWARGRGVKALSEMIKTAVAKDPTGRTLGVRITGMTKGLPAGAFDIRRGDILVSINGQGVAGPDDALRIAKTLDPDSEQLVTLVVDRNGQRFTYRVDARDPKTKRKFVYFARG